MKTAILKLSGKAIEEFLTDDKWLNIINKLKSSYDGLVLVHGAGTKISEWSEKQNIETNFVDGQRVTCDKTMEIVAAVQSGLLNSKIVSFLLANNFESAGLTPNDRGLFVADYINEKLGFVGSPKLIGDTSWLTNMILEGVIPVFSSICRDKDGNLMNVNADTFTKELGKAIQADTVMFLSDVDGVLIEGNSQPMLTEASINKGIADGHITGGMIPKLQSSLDLINNYTNKVWIGKELTNLNYNSIGADTNLGGTWIVNSKQFAVGF